jgi:hypothetical protein
MSSTDISGVAAFVGALIVALSFYGAYCFIYEPTLESLIVILAIFLFFYLSAMVSKKKEGYKTPSQMKTDCVEHCIWEAQDPDECEKWCTPNISMRKEKCCGR